MAGKKKNCSGCSGNKSRTSSYSSYAKQKLDVLRVGEEIETSDGRTFKIVESTKNSS